MATEATNETENTTKPKAKYEEDMWGRKFSVTVDGEHKATEIKLQNCANPHMHAFHASWFGFFSTFFSTFAPAPLAPTLKLPNTLALTRTQLSMGGIASVTTNIFCRLIMGLVCDKMGARKGLAFVLLITAPAIIGIAFVQGPVGFIVCRAIIGMGLASFVACQVWCSQMFSKSVVGIANATAGGWGNLGGGITTLCMPLVYRLFMLITNSENVAWRLCFIIPLVLHLVGAAAAYTGRDLPDGNYKELEKLGAKQKSDSSVVTKVGFSNINAWILTLTYGLCFGVELTMTNIATLYYYEYHAFSQTLSATLASIFGLVNICARSLGGITSDWCNRTRPPRPSDARAPTSRCDAPREPLPNTEHPCSADTCALALCHPATGKYGMRGRIWALWIFQTIEGILCIAMGLVTLGATGPSFTASEDVIGFVKVENDWVAFNGTGITQRIVPCGSLQVEITALDAAAVGALDPRLAAMNTVVLSEPPAPWGNGSECVSNSNTAAAVRARPPSNRDHAH